MRARSRSPIHWLSPPVLMLLLTGLPAFAADAPKKGAAAAAGDKAKAAQEAAMAEMMKYAKPGPMHALLDPLVGTWKTVNKSWMGPGEPTVSEGTCERTWLMGGRFPFSMIGTNDGKDYTQMEITYTRVK